MSTKKVQEFVDEMHSRKETNVMSARWAYAAGQEISALNYRIFRLVKYPDMFEGMEIPLAELIVELLPVELSRNNYGLETAVVDALKKFAKSLFLDDNDPTLEKIRLGCDIYMLLEPGWEQVGLFAKLGGTGDEDHIGPEESLAEAARVAGAEEAIRKQIEKQEAHRAEIELEAAAEAKAADEEAAVTKMIQDALASPVVCYCNRFIRSDSVGGPGDSAIARMVCDNCGRPMLEVLAESAKEKEAHIEQLRQARDGANKETAANITYRTQSWEPGDLAKETAKKIAVDNAAADAIDVEREKIVARLRALTERFHK